MDSAQTTHQTGSQTTSSHYALLWAGAAVSIAEILRTCSRLKNMLG
ncbi:hypothetical protein HG533_09450 [Moraxella osloensis]|nr:hypothetical protein [Moraxella osloensis]MBW4019016.1 hypothetical protein [Moraxella osloensis]